MTSARTSFAQIAVVAIATAGFCPAQLQFEAASVKPGATPPNDGTPRNVVSPLEPGLDEAAMNALYWRFKPGKQDGVPITVPAQIDFTFRIL